MKKKIIAILLAITMAFTMTAFVTALADDLTNDEARDIIIEDREDKGQTGDVGNVSVDNPPSSTGEQPANDSRNDQDSVLITEDDFEEYYVDYFEDIVDSNDVEQLKSDAETASGGKAGMTYTTDADEEPIEPKLLKERQPDLDLEKADSVVVEVEVEVVYQSTGDEGQYVKTTTYTRTETAEFTEEGEWELISSVLDPDVDPNPNVGSPVVVSVTNDGVTITTTTTITTIETYEGTFQKTTTYIRYEYTITLVTTETWDYDLVNWTAPERDPETGEIIGDVPQGTEDWQDFYNPDTGGLGGANNSAVREGRMFIRSESGETVTIVIDSNNAISGNGNTRITVYAVKDGVMTTIIIDRINNGTYKVDLTAYGLTDVVIGVKGNKLDKSSSSIGGGGDFVTPGEEYVKVWDLSEVLSGIDGYTVTVTENTDTVNAGYTITLVSPSTSSVPVTGGGGGGTTGGGGGTTGGGEGGTLGGGEEGGAGAITFLGGGEAGETGEGEAEIVEVAAAGVPLAAPEEIGIVGEPEAEGTPVEIIDLGEMVTPLVEIGNSSSWHLWNLILSVAGIALAVAMGIRAFSKKKKEDEQIDEDPQNRKKSLILSLAIPVAAIAACVVFILTQDLTAPMAYVDQWTALHAGLFAAGLISFIFADRKEKEEAQAIA